MRQCRKCEKTKDESEYYIKCSKTRRWVSHTCKECTKEYERVRHQTWYRDKHLEIQKRYHRKLKLELITAYGGKCECCGESKFEFLQLDHVNGGGAQHRKKLTIHMSSHLKKMGYPKGDYRLLCANCNSSLGLYGYCPHKI
jgi:hypothetical protein